MVEQESHLNEALYRQLIEYAREVLFLISPDWQIVYYISPSYEDVWGKTCQSLMAAPLSWTDSIHPDDKESVLRYIEQKSRSDLDDINFPDYRVIRPDGVIRWIKARGMPIKNAEGVIYRVAGIAMDVSEQKEKEIELRRSQESLEMVLEGSEQGFWDWNIETGEVERNHRWAQILGYTSIDEFEDSTDTWTDLIHPDDRDAAWASINDHLEGRTSCHKMEYRMITKDGGYKWILDNAKIVQRDTDGRPLRMSGTHSDISERKRLESEREDLIKSLQEALSEIKTLKGIIPICSYCHKIRNDKGAWDEIEAYISKHSDLEFSHGICPSCLHKVRSNLGLNNNDEQ